jgi:hypothetical protein
MATRAALAALLFVIPALVAAYVQLGGIPAGLPSGLASLISGPSQASVAGSDPTAKEGIADIAELVSSDAAAGGGGAASGGSGGSTGGGDTGGDTGGGDTGGGTTLPGGGGGDTTGPLDTLLNDLGLNSALPQ